MSANNKIMYNIQTIFNLLPNLNVPDLVTSMLVKTNDMHLVVYVSSLIRSVVALHDLVNNRIRANESEGAEEKKDEKKVEEKAAVAVK